MTTPAMLARRFASLPLLVVFITALTLSWHGLAALGASAGIGGLSWLLPLVIDGTTLSGALAVVVATASGTSTRFGWALMLGGAAVSTYGNVAASPVSGFTAALTHAAAPLALALTLEAWLRTVRHDIALKALEDAAEAERVEKAARAEAAREARARNAAEKGSKGATGTSKAGKGAHGSKRSKTPNAVEMDRLSALVANLPEDASLTARARVVLADTVVSGSVLATLLGCTTAQGNRARERALRAQVVTEPAGGSDSGSEGSSDADEGAGDPEPAPVLLHA